MDLDKATNIGTQSLRDIVQSLKNMCFSTGAWAEGTNDHTIQNASAVNYMIDGVIKQKGATNNIAATTCVIQPAGRRCRYLVTLNAAGTVTTVKGTQVVSLTTGAVTTLAWDAVEKKLLDSAGLLAFKAGDLITISGFTEDENNGTFTVQVVDPAGKWLQVVETGMITEIAGDSVTVLRESALPECPAKNAATAILVVTTGATSFTMGTQDFTDDIGTGSIAVVNIGIVPTDMAV